jgi:parallel beta-helix repeat protein
MSLQIIMFDTLATSNNTRSYDLIVSKNGMISSIQQAIDISSTSDVILIKNGTYKENLVIDKTITLIGENKTLTIIDGRNSGNVIKINAEYVIIEQLTIQNSGKIFPNSGINLTGSNSNIKNNVIKNNYYGMTLYETHNNIIQNNEIKNDYNCGIYICKSSFNYLQNNTITNHTYNGFGIYDSSNHNIIKNNLLTYNGYCGINLRKSTNNTIIENTITDNNIGIHIPLNQNRIENNTFSNNIKKIDKEAVLPNIPGFEFLTILLVFIIIIYFKQSIKL